jgi:predicted  nucleic acid-binding Zn-ribbon protein
VTQERILTTLKKLVELQKVDKEIYTLAKELEEHPGQLARLQEQFETKQLYLKKLEENLKALQVSRNVLEVELQAKEDAIAKANSQLSQIKTNKEYAAKLSEIENIKSDKSIIEEKILRFYDETDAVKASVVQEKKVLAQEEQAYVNKKQEIENVMKGIADRVKVLQGQRTQRSPDVDRATLSRYDRIVAHKVGLAIVPVIGSVCQGCFMNVPAQVINEIKSHKEFIYCEICSRILYLEEDVA